MASTELKAVISLDDQITSGLKKIKNQTSSMSGKFANAGKSVAGNAAKMAKNIGLVTTAVGAVSGVIGNDFVNAASDLNEAQNAVDVVFGESSETLKEYAKTASKTAGLAKAEFLQATTPIGAAFVNMGKSQEDAADMSITLAERAADLSSVFNKDLSTSINAIQAGLRGEAEPLEQFGVNLSAANVEAKALSMGLADNAKDLTDSQKQTARYNLLLEESNRVSGDFQNTSDGLANSQRVLSKQFTNLKADIGKGLIPIKLALVNAGMRVVEMINNNREQINSFGNKVKQVGGRVLEFSQTFAEQAIPKLKEFHKNQVKPFIATVQNQVIPQIKHWIRVTKLIIKEIADFLQPFIEKLVTTIKSEWKPIMEQLMPLLKTMATILGAALVGAIALAISFITTIIEKLGSFARWIDTVKERLGNIVDFIQSFVVKIADFFTWLWKTLVGNSIIPDMLNAIWDWFKSVLDRVLGFVGGIFTDIYNTVKKWMGDALSAIKGALDDIWSTTNRIFKEVVVRIAKHVKDVYRTARDWFKKVYQTIKGWVKKALNVVGSVFSEIWGTINHHVTRVLETISKIFSEIWGTINHHVNNAWNTISDIFSNIWGTVNHWVNEVWGTVNHIFQSLTDTVFEKFDSWYGHIRHAIHEIKKFFHNSSKSIQDAITGPFNQAKDWIQDTFAGLNIGDIFGDMIRGLPNGQKILNELPSFASGTNNFEGGFARVGERGPETVFLPKGSQVNRASDSQGGQKVVYNVSINNPQVRDDQDMMAMERQIENVLTKVQRRKKLGI